MRYLSYPGELEYNSEDDDHIDGSDVDDFEDADEYKEYESDADEDDAL